MRTGGFDLFSVEKRPACKIDRPEIEPAVLLLEDGVKQAELVGLELYMGPGMSSDDGPATQRIDRHILDLDAVLQDDDLVGRVGKSFFAREQPIAPGFAATYETFG